MREVTNELSVLYPTLRSLMAGRALTVGSPDSVATVVATWSRLPSPADRSRIQRFLMERLRLDSLRVQHIAAP